eukprot:jgi/Chlat1/5357/Chrsp35S05288
MPAAVAVVGSAAAAATVAAGAASTSRVSLRPSFGTRLPALPASNLSRHAHIRTARTPVTCAVTGGGRRSRKTAQTGSQEAEPAEDKKKKLVNDMLGRLGKQYGENTVMRWGDATAFINAKLERISTGALNLDIALDGGFPKGRIIQILGPESSGKTTLALHAIAEVQANGGMAMLVDAENALDPDYASNCGVDVGNLIYHAPEYGEQALNIIESVIQSGAVDLIVVDSVAALVPKAELEGEVGDATMGQQARMMSQALRKLTTKAGTTGTTLIFINQYRSKIGVFYGSPDVTPGGRALNYFASVILDIRKTSGSGMDDGVSRPIVAVDLAIIYGFGIDKTESVLSAAEAPGYDIITRKGSWYYYANQSLGQGKETAAKFLKERPDVLKEIEEAVRAKCLSEKAGRSLNGQLNGNLGMTSEIEEELVEDFS